MEFDGFMTIPPGKFAHVVRMAHMDIVRIVEEAT